jgi:predicted ester cyclase
MCMSWKGAHQFRLWRWSPTARRPAGMPDRGQIEGFYRGYNAACNAHDFDRLGEFVARSIRVNGEAQTLAEYAAGLEQVVRAFPDYRWDLHHLLVDGDWIAAHFADTGTHRGTAFGVRPPAEPSARKSSRSTGIEAGKIVEAWVTADDLDLLTQLQD